MFADGDQYNLRVVEKIKKKVAVDRKKLQMKVENPHLKNRIFKQAITTK